MPTITPSGLLYDQRPAYDTGALWFCAARSYLFRRQLAALTNIEHHGYHV
jgi:hypothetical protein